MEKIKQFFKRSQLWLCIR